MKITFQNVKPKEPGDYFCKFANNGIGLVRVVDVEGKFLGESYLGKFLDVSIYNGLWSEKLEYA